MTRKSRRGNSRSTFRFLLFMSFLVVAIILLRSGLIGIEWTPDTLRGRIDDLGNMAPLIYLVAVPILINLMVPFSLLTVAAGVAFGWQTALLMGIPAMILAHILGYAVSAVLMREEIRRILDRMGWSESFERIEQRSTWQIAFAVRFLPIPVGAQNYLLGLARTPFIPYLLGSLAGALPWLVAFTLLGESATLSLGVPFLIGVAVYCVLVLSTDRWWRGRERRENNP
ncbi:TVP38/TMEM64 family protein [Gemmatimonadota bacterium]